MTYKTRLLASFCTAALAACLAAPAAATPIVGTVTAKDSYSGYMGEMTDIQVLAGTMVLPETAFIFCIDMGAAFPARGSAHQYTLSDSFAQVMQNPGAIDKATGLLHYVVDNYYAPFRAGAYGMDAGYGFNQVMWELTSDFSGSVASLSTAAGSIYGTRALYQSVIADLRDNFASIAPGYRSDRYDIAFLEDMDSAYQTLAMVSERASNDVPEPSTLALLLAGGFGWTVRAARRKAAAA